MHFWSKGLGTKTLELDLSKGEAIKGGDVLYLRGDMEPPITWDYIMPLRGRDIVDFLDLLHDPGLPGFVQRSPERARLYWAMARHGIELVGLLLVAIVRHVLGLVPAEPAVEIQVPPESVLKKRKKKKATPEKPARKAYRRRLKSSTTSAPSLTTAMREQHHDAPADDSVEDAIQEAMEAASHAGESDDE